jgi:hypothetical protein
MWEIETNVSPPYLEDLIPSPGKLVPHICEYPYAELLLDLFRCCVAYPLNLYLSKQEILDLMTPSSP